jgi:hypothetical protein
VTGLGSYEASGFDFALVLALALRAVTGPLNQTAYHRYVLTRTSVFYDWAVTKQLRMGDGWPSAVLLYPRFHASNRLAFNER